MKKLTCSYCKNYRHVGRGFGEPSGTCSLKVALIKLAKSYGVKKDYAWREATGPFAPCDIFEDIIRYEKDIKDIIDDLD